MKTEKRHHTVKTAKEILKKIKNEEIDVLTLMKTEKYRMGDYIELISQEEGIEESVCKKISYIMHSKDKPKEIVLGLNKGAVATLYKKEWVA